MKSVLVIGMSNFGQLLAKEMKNLGNDVMIVDNDERIINELADEYTDSAIGNCTKKDVLESLGINNFDICFVTIDNDFQTSLEITYSLHEMGAKMVIAKAERDIEAKFLLKNGADQIVYPEKDMAHKLAIRCNSERIFDLFELANGYDIIEISVPSKWYGQTIKDLDIRRKFETNILAIKSGGQLNPVPSPDYIFKQEDHILVLGKYDEVMRINSIR